MFCCVCGRVIVAVSVYTCVCVCVCVCVLVDMWRRVQDDGRLPFVCDEIPHVFPHMFTFTPP